VIFAIIMYSVIFKFKLPNISVN